MFDTVTLIFVLSLTSTAFRLVGATTDPEVVVSAYVTDSPDGLTVKSEVENRPVIEYCTSLDMVVEVKDGAGSSASNVNVTVESFVDPSDSQLIFTPDPVKEVDTVIYRPPVTG